MRNYNKTSFVFVAFFLIVPFFIWAQEKTNMEALDSFAKEKALMYQQKKSEAVQLFQQKGYPTRIETADRLMELQFIDELGYPQFFITDNINAAATISTNRLYSGSGSGFNLSGTGITIREWDGGAVLVSHQEFGGRAVKGDSYTTTSYHCNPCSRDHDGMQV